MYYPCRHSEIVTIILTILLTLGPTSIFADTGTTQLSTNVKSLNIVSKNTPRVAQELQTKGLLLGNPVFIRIFKISRTLQVWVQKNENFILFKNYPICNYSGYPGPKLSEGDRQSPEGFYTVSSEQMNPWSEHHLSFNIGYPNDYDRANKRTGSAIMIHGGCTSQGCYAMGDHRMEEIYTIVNSALKNGQMFLNVHIFPFELTTENLHAYRHSPWLYFWNNLKIGYDTFELTKKVPKITIKNGQYTFNTDLQLSSSK